MRPRRARRAQTERERLPLRKSLLGRLLAASALVAACSVAATAWLAVQTTSGAIKQQQGQNLADDARIYDTLVGYAATHPRWDGVEATVRAMARQSGRRITLTTEQRQPLADSAGGPERPALPTRASAVVDPLSVDSAIVAGTASATDRIDPRAVGPFRLPARERAQLRDLAEQTAMCLQKIGLASEIVEGPGGRPRIEPVGKDFRNGLVRRDSCPTDELDQPTTTENRALAALNTLVDACLDRQRLPGVRLHPDLSWDPGKPRPVAKGESFGALEPAVASCLATARHEQLGAYVAPPALLFITDPGGGDTTDPGFTLSAANTARIAGVAALVLALTVGASVLAGSRLVRPLRALTGAAQRMKDGDDAGPVPVTGDNEIARLAAAFNDMAAHRARLEEQRKVMVSDVAHELRTPLSTIRGWLEGAQDGIAEPDPAFIASLLEEAVQLQHIVDDLQDLAQADAGALRLRPEPAVRIEDILGQAAAAHRGAAEGAGVTLTVGAPEGTEPPPLTADPVRLRQAVGNLVSNAVRHTPEGGSVTLRAYGSGNADGEGELVVVEVADTGTGIPAEDLPYVFDRFWRAEKSRSRRTGGSGLGLAIVRKLAEAHGGTVEVRSTVGEGSVFTLRLPAGGVVLEENSGLTVA
ncbi:HAMP domain-containing sensor histidine kinase [Streptomyces sp. NPDC000410]|uniref:sensor histidine kinase n=1 Tax=Streptomyces sp. NPDC000410 TaxID=3154254 RepID=UPI00332E9C80